MTHWNLRICIAFLASFLSYKAISQTDSLQFKPLSPLAMRLARMHTAFSRNDTNYITTQSVKWKLSVQNNNWMDVYELENDSASSLGLSSELCANIGMTVTYKFISIGYSVNLNRALSHKSTGNTFNVNMNYNRVSASVYYLKNAGNTVITDFADSQIQKELSHPFQGLSIKSYGVDLLYYFNHQRFSNGAAYFGYNSRQRKSAGSFITGLQIARQKLLMDFQGMQDTVVPKAFLKMSPISFNYTGICGSFGYGYSFVFAPNWLLNLTDIVAFGVRRDYETTHSHHNSLVKNSVRLALVNNTPTYYWGFNCQYLTNMTLSQEISLANSLAIFNVFAGFRLK